MLFIVHTKDSAFTVGEYNVTRSSFSAAIMSSCTLGMPHFESTTIHHAPPKHMQTQRTHHKQTPTKTTSPTSMMGITTMMIMYTVGKATPVGEGEAMPVGEGEAVPIGEEKAMPVVERKTMPVGEGKATPVQEEGGRGGSRKGRGREEGSEIPVSYHRMPFQSIDGKKLLTH